MAPKEEGESFQTPFQPNLTPMVNSTKGDPLSPAMQQMNNIIQATQATQTQRTEQPRPAIAPLMGQPTSLNDEYMQTLKRRSVIGQV